MKITRSLKAYVTKVNDDYTLDVAIASDNSEDRMGEIIDQEGWDLANFKKNPVFLWAHKYGEPPIGKVIDIKVIDNKLIFKPKFAADISEFAMKIFKLYKGGYLNAFSVGFNPSEREGNTFKKVELLEISAVPVPCNANALVVAREMGVELDREIKEVILQPAQDFVEESLKTLDVEDSVRVTVGLLSKPLKTGTKIQKYLFLDGKKTEEEQKKWIANHKHINYILRKKILFDGKELSKDEVDKIKMVLKNTKLTTGVLEKAISLLETADGVKVADGVGTKDEKVIRIVRTALKSATKQLETANRTIKILNKK